MKQTIYRGINYLDVALKGCNKVLLVCDKSFSALNIRSNLENINVPFVKFDDFTSNPLYEDVCKAVDVFNEEGCDAVLAVGGGSSIDVGKCVKLYCRMDKGINYLDQAYSDTGIKLIVIPTTAGTGSESTRYAVIYYDGIKQSVTHDSIIPDIAILEPIVLKTLPSYQKKCTMLDALCQGIESWWSVNSTDESKVISKEAVEIIMQWWREYIFKNTDESAKHIMYAANLAGQAICITQTTAPHAFSYKITSLYHIPHGHAVAICLSVIWEYMINNIDKCIDSRGPKYLEGIFKDISLSMGVKNPNEAIDVFTSMLSDMEIKNPKSNNLTTDILLLSSSVNPVRLKNNPLKLDEDTICDLYYSIVK